MYCVLYSECPLKEVPLYIVGHVDRLHCKKATLTDSALLQMMSI